MVSRKEAHTVTNKLIRWLSQNPKHVASNKTHKKSGKDWTICASFLLHLYRNGMSSITILVRVGQDVTSGSNCRLRILCKPKTKILDRFGPSHRHSSVAQRLRIQTSKDRTWLVTEHSDRISLICSILGRKRWHNIQSNPGIAPPSPSARHYSRYAATNCSMQTVALYRSLTPAATNTYVGGLRGGGHALLSLHSQKKKKPQVQYVEPQEGHTFLSPLSP